MTPAELSVAIIAAVEYLTRNLLWTVLLIAIAITILHYILNYFTIGYDDSDNKTTKERSGFKVYTDHKTGLQYLVTSNSITPRLNISGKHMMKTIP